MCVQAWNKKKMSENDLSSIFSSVSSLPTSSLPYLLSHIHSLLESPSSSSFSKPIPAEFLTTMRYGFDIGGSLGKIAVFVPDIMENMSMEQKKLIGFLFATEKYTPLTQF